MSQADAKPLPFVYQFAAGKCTDRGNNVKQLLTKFQVPWLVCLK